MYELALYDQIGPFQYVRMVTERYDSLSEARFQAETIIEVDHVDGARADMMRILDWNDQILDEWLYGAADPDSDARWHSAI